MPAPLHRTDGGCGFPTLSLSFFSSFFFFPTPPYLYKEQKKGAAPDPLGTNSCGRSRLTYWRGSSTLSRYRCAWRISPPSVGCTHTTTQNTSMNNAIQVGPTKLSTCSDREYATLLRLPQQQAPPSPTRTKAGAYEEPSGGPSLFFAQTFFPLRAIRTQSAQVRRPGLV